MSAPRINRSSNDHANFSDENNTFDNVTIDNEKEAKLKSYLLDGKTVWGAIFVFIFLHLSFVHYRLLQFPPAQTLVPGAPLDSFYESNARIHLEQLALHGPRVVGSESNEKYAHSYILQQLHEIQANVNSRHNITVDEQVVSGNFDLTFITDFVSVYRNIKNLVAKIEPSEGSDHSLLMSCHFDSAVDSPGAGDNAISCAVMLEMLRALSQSKTSPHYAIIFLFNGAEENILQASHGFITQHPMAKSVRAFVNIDSAGAGGWETVFQTGPFHPWLVRAYAQSSPRPCGSILGQELFQSGLIPSDTDYRIFRDFGEIPGLDMAYISNGYVYHTPNDKNKFIEPGCIQRGGENLLALLRKLATSPELVDPGLDKHGIMVFFDVVGMVMIYYPMNVAMIVNCGFIAAVFYKVISKVMGDNTAGAVGLAYLRDLSTAVLFLLITLLIVVLTNVAMAMCLTLLGRNMSWFTVTYNLLPLYIFPPVLAAIVFHHTLRNRFYQNKDPWQLEMLYFEASLMFWAIITLIGTYYGVGSAFFSMLYVLGPILIRDRTMQIGKNWHWKSRPLQFLGLHLASLSFPVLLNVYTGFACLRLFVPIMGRSGSEVNTDVVIGVILALLLFMVLSYMVSLCYLSQNLDKVIQGLAIITVVWICAILITPLGFPFSGNPDAPSQQRIIAVHSDRVFHDLSGAVTYEDSALWVLAFDVTRNSALQKTVPSLSSASHTECNMAVPFCGLPYLIPVLKMMDPRSGLYMPASRANLPRVPCKMIEKMETAEYTKLTFQVLMTGPDHISMYVRPHSNVSLISWSLSTQLPEPVHMPDDIIETSYFVYYSHASLPDTPWTFSMFLKVNGEHSPESGWVDLAFAGHHLHGQYQVTNDMRAFQEQLPDWASPVTWSASYDGYQF